jgi:uncharacterized protein YxjI
MTRNGYNQTGIKEQMWDKETKFEFRKQFFKLAGGAFRVYDSSSQLVLFSEQKAFKLREDIRIYSDESKTREVLAIRTGKILDISATYEVSDSTTAEKIGALKRKGIKSILKDEWEILDPQGMLIGRIEEDSTVLALVRRFLTNLVPQSYSFFVQNQKVGEFRQHFNFFVYHATLDVSPDPNQLLDRRLALSAGILLMAIEGKQD